MKNLYYNQIVEYLFNKPEGIRLINIIRHVYNSNSGLFEDPDLYSQINKSVRTYLWRQSKKNNSPFIRVPKKWGCYALKRGFVVQLELCFDNWEYDIVETKTKKTVKEEPPMPNLFGW